MAEDKFAKTIEDDELDEVVGGTVSDFVKDFKFLNALGVADKDLNDKDIIEAANAKNTCWTYRGITCFPNENGSNRYMRDDIEISRQDALIYVMRKAGKLVDLDKYV